MERPDEPPPDRGGNEAGFGRREPPPGSAGSASCPPPHDAVTTVLPRAAGPNARYDPGNATHADGRGPPRRGTEQAWRPQVSARQRWQAGTRARRRHGALGRTSAAVDRARTGPRVSVPVDARSRRRWSRSTPRTAPSGARRGRPARGAVQVGPSPGGPPGEGGRRGRAAFGQRGADDASSMRTRRRRRRPKARAPLGAGRGRVRPDAVRRRTEGAPASAGVRREQGTPGELRDVDASATVRRRLGLPGGARPRSRRRTPPGGTDGERQGGNGAR